MRTFFVFMIMFLVPLVAQAGGGTGNPDASDTASSGCITQVVAQGGLPEGVELKRDRMRIDGKWQVSDLVTRQEGYRFVETAANEVLLVRSPGSPGIPSIEGRFRCDCRGEGDDNCAVEKKGNDVSCVGQCIEDRRGRGERRPCHMTVIQRR